MNLICLLYIKMSQAVVFIDDTKYYIIHSSLIYIVTMSIRRSSHKLSQIDEHQLQGEISVLALC
jgi:hypothetical protein